MQDKKLNYVLLSVPLEALEDAGIRPGSLLEITAEEKKVCIRAVADLSDFVCDGDCENRPVNELDCAGNSGGCPCTDKCADAEVGRGEDLSLTRTGGEGKERG